MNRSWLLLLLGGALLFAGTLWWTQSPDTPRPLDSQQSSDPVVELLWRAGDVRSYHFNIDSSMKLTVAGPQAGSVDVVTTGRLEFHILEVEDENVLTGVQLGDVELSVSGQSDASSTDLLVAPFRVVYSQTGMPIRFDFSESTPAETRTILENIVRTFQVEIRAASGSWTAQEQHPSGTFKADYRVSGNGELVKSKREFTPSANHTMLGDARISSEERILIDKDHVWLESMEIQDSLVLASGGGQDMEIINRAILHTDPGGRTYTDSALFAFTATVAEAEPVRTNQTDSDDRTPGQLRSDFERLLPELDGTQEGRTLLIHQLRDVLILNPELPAALIQQLATELYSDRTRADMYLALELAGTAQAQAALVSVFADETWSLKDGLRAIIALSSVAEPNNDSLSALWTSVEAGSSEIASTALLATGTMGSTLRNHQPEVYATVRDRLLAGAIGSFDTRRRADYVSALGNTRDQNLAPDILALLQDPETQVRRAAALSLSLTGNGDSVEPLLERIELEKQGEVRAAIASTLSQLPVGEEAEVDRVLTLIADEPEERVRMEMARYLENHMIAGVTRATTIRTLLRTEPSRRVRQRLGAALAAIELNSGRQ